MRNGEARRRQKEREILRNSESPSRRSRMEPAMLSVDGSRNNSAICVIVQNPNSKGSAAGGNNARGRADITADMRWLNVGQEW